MDRTKVARLLSLPARSSLCPSFSLIKYGIGRDLQIPGNILCGNAVADEVADLNSEAQLPVVFASQQTIGKVGISDH